MYDDDCYEEEALYENSCAELSESSLVYPLLVFFIGVVLVFLFDGDRPEQAAKNERFFPAPDISPIFTPEVRFWADDILRWASETNLDPNLIATVMQIESCGDPRATSPSGAKGLFQVMPYHFYAGENPYYPEVNAQRGLAYLKKSLDTARGNFYLAFAGYNGGIGIIARSEIFWAEETKRYAYWGSGIYADARRGVFSSPRLEEWLRYGGASLCAQARASW